MADALSTAERLAARLARGEAEGLTGEDLDALLHWLADPADGSPLERALRERALEPERIRRVAYHALDRRLFATDEGAPHRVLGLGRGDGGLTLRERYRLLMRVYHPDRGLGSPDWLDERASRINEAYRLAREQVHGRRPEAKEPAGAAASVLDRAPRAGHGRRAARSRRRSRKRSGRYVLGSPHALRRRALLWLVLAGGALVVHTFVANQAWRHRGGDPVGSVASQGVGP